jgi:hypothetical protein
LANLPQKGSNLPAAGEVVVTESLIPWKSELESNFKQKCPLLFFFVQE